jgi:hypothetical protein
MRIIVPKTYVSLEQLYPGPLFFLVDPVRGGGDWQHTMCMMIGEQMDDATIVVPCRWQEWEPKHPLATDFMRGQEDVFPRQLDMERHYLELAGFPSPLRGCIICWLEKESETEPHPGPEPYAMDTRGEVARWAVHKMYDPDVRMVVGAHNDFHGLSQIERNITADWKLKKPFRAYRSMAQTIVAAERVAKGLQTF